MVAAVEQIRTGGAVALMDMYCEAGYKGRPVMFAFFGMKDGPAPVRTARKPEPVEDEWA